MNSVASFEMEMGSTFLKISASELLDECWGGSRWLCHESFLGFSDNRYPCPLKGYNFLQVHAVHRASNALLQLFCV